MNEVIIQGVFSVTAAAIGGLIAILATRSSAEVSMLKNEKKELEKSSASLLRQIESYHLLEDLYAQDIAECREGCAPRTIKTQYRDAVVKNHQCERPEMTAGEAKKRLKMSHNHSA